MGLEEELQMAPDTRGRDDLVSCEDEEDHFGWSAVS